MAIPFHKTVSSIDSICKTIENDPHTYRWFVKFISNPNIRERLKQSIPDQKRFMELKTLENLKIMSFILFFLLIAAAFTLKLYLIFLFLLPLFIAIRIISKNHMLNITEISRSFLIMEPESFNLEKKTLFQICEIYGKQLEIPTLVDIITKQDDILRKTVIFAIVITCFVYPFNFWNNWLFIIASFLTIQTLINTPLVFNRLK